MSKRGEKPHEVKLGSSQNVKFTREEGNYRETNKESVENVGGHKYVETEKPRSIGERCKE